MRPENRLYIWPTHRIMNIRPENQAYLWPPPAQSRPTILNWDLPKLKDVAEVVNLVIDFSHAKIDNELSTKKSLILWHQSPESVQLSYFNPSSSAKWPFHWRQRNCLELNKTKFNGKVLSAPWINMLWIGGEPRFKHRPSITKSVTLLWDGGQITLIWTDSRTVRHLIAIISAGRFYRAKEKLVDII